MKKYTKNFSGALHIIHNKFAIPNIVIITLALMMILGMSACGPAGNPSSPQNPPKALEELSGTIDIGSAGDVTIGMELIANYTGPEGVAYQWKKSGAKVGANTKIFIPPAAGSYTVTVSAEGFKNKTSSAVTVKAEPTPGLDFTLDSITKTYSVSKGTITDYTVVIPAEYKGLPVTVIADNGFANYSGMTFIGIPDSVTSIGDNAFSGCTGLTSIAIPFVGQNGSVNPYAEPV